MFCTQCGKEMRDADRFCGQCGASPGGEPPPRPAQATPAGPPKRLTLSRDGKKLGGVCAGFAEYLDWDVTLVRLLYLCCVVYSVGLALLAYLIAWIVMPAAPLPVARPYAAALPAARSI